MGLLDWFGLSGNSSLPQVGVRNQQTGAFTMPSLLQPHPYGIDPRQLRLAMLSQGLLGLGAGLLSGRNWGEGLSTGLLGAQQGMGEARQNAIEEAILRKGLEETDKPELVPKPEALKFTGPGGIDFTVDPETGLTSLWGPGGPMPLSSLPGGQSGQPAQGGYKGLLAGFESAGGTDTTNPLNANVEGPYQIDKRYWPEGTTISDVLKSNATEFQKRFGREPNDWEQYGMHRLGAAGYAKLLTAKPDTPVLTAFGDAIVGDNPDLMKAMTVGGVRSLFKERFGEGKTWKELGEAGGQPLMDWATFQTPRQAAQTNPVEIANTMRGEFTKLTKDYRDTSVAYQKIESAANNPSAAGDLSLIFGFMKLLDPGSTVREGEFATAQNSAGVPQQVVNIYNRLLNGERLAPEQRADFAGQAKNVFAVYQRQYDNLKSQYEAIATANGIDPKNVIIEGGVPAAAAPDEIDDILAKPPGQWTAEERKKIEEYIGP